MPFAFDEFNALASSIPPQSSRNDAKLWYAASMVAELCYYHVPKFEIDSRKRAKVIPCDAYQQILLTGLPTDVVNHLQAADFVRIFVITDRGVIAIGIQIGTRLFVGFRGTVFLYDWRINLRVPLISLDSGFVFRPGSVHSVGTGRFHRGFSEEAVRMAVRIWQELEKKTQNQIDEVILCGHSLGGAIAAICEPMLWGAGDRVRTVLLGSPRYCDAAALYGRPGNFPIQIKRWGDMVPSIPPRSLGYADCPWEFNTSGEPVFESMRSSKLKHFLWYWTLFINKRFEPHNVEGYRRELGTACGAKGSELLLDAAKLSRSGYPKGDYESERGN